MRTTFSPDRRYRYTLARDWMFGQGVVLFVLLNPSTADENHNDPTIRRCISFAQDWGYRGLLVGELFGIRSTDPRVLKSDPDPIGPDNDRFLQAMAQEAALVVFAWGNWGKVRNRSAQVAAMFTGAKCFGITAQGEPIHPLYQARTAALIPFLKGEL